MTAMSHSFRTEVENRSIGKPSFLSHHLESLCPSGQEEDEWLEQELDRARQQRGGFYRKIVNSRAASARELEDLAAARHRNASLGSTDFSVSQSASSSSSPPTIPEPHSSWRFYTSYDNGEWKRHCVPVYKPEEEILRKSPSSDVDKELSPAYESHLRKYRQARASLFDKPSRRFHSSSTASPQSEATTVRVETRGGTGGLRSAMGGSPSRLPFGGSATDIFSRSGGLEEMSSAPLPTHYREETTTSETITTVDGQVVPQLPKPQLPSAQLPAAQLPAARAEPTRPKHNNLGYKEKIIIPTKYKSQNEIEEADIKAKLSELTKRTEVAEIGAEKKEEKKQKPLSEKSASDEPCYLGSTFEKFSYKGVPLVKPQFVDKENTKERNMVGTNAKVSVEFVKRKPVFDTPPQVISPVHNKPNFERTSEVFFSGTDKTSRSPATIQNSSVERRSLPFGPPENIALGRDSVKEKFSTSDDQIQPLSDDAFKILADSFQAHTVNNTNGERPSNSLTAERINKDLTTSSSQQSSSTIPSKSDGVIFIPVIRVMAPNPEGRHRTQLSIDVNAGSKTQVNGKVDGLTGNEILELDEDLSEGVSNNIQRRNIGEINVQKIGGQSNDNASLHFGINRRHQNGAVDDKSNNEKTFTDIPSEILKDIGKTNLSELSADSSFFRIKPEFPSTTESFIKEIPKFSSSISGPSQIVTQKSSSLTDRLPIGEKIIIPSRYKEKGQEVDRAVNEGKNTDCGPARISSTAEETFDDQLKSEPTAGRVGFSNTNISIKQRPDVSLNPIADEKKTSSISTTVYETRREKPIFPSEQRRFSSSIEVVPQTSVLLNPSDGDLSKQINITYELKSTTHPNRGGNDSGFVVKTANPSIEPHRQVHQGVSPSLGVTSSNEGSFIRRFVDDSVGPDALADEDWVVERAVPF